MSNEKPLQNASEIIERFGGIRPMAAKINTPVTTVQGWKKRDVIPATRRDQIIKAASDNNIDISDLTNGGKSVNENKISSTTVREPEQSKPRIVSTNDEPVKKSTPVMETPKNEDKEEFKASMPSAKPRSQDDIFAAIEANNRKVLMNSTWIATALILVAAVIVFAFMGGSSNKKTPEAQMSQMEQQQKELQELKASVKEVNERTSRMGSFVPQGMQDKMDSLQTQAQNIQNTVDQLADRAGQISSEFSSDILGPNAGPLTQRLEMLEQKMAELSSQGNFGNMVERISNLENSFIGQEQLKNSVVELQNMVSSIETNQSEGTLDENLAQAQQQGQGALSETLQGVSGNDLKAAAMLIAFSQLRDSLDREAPFDNDLALLERLVDEDNVELKGAIESLAPHANGGVLTASGLSNEFKGLTGDILEASLKGEDISFMERAKARLNNLMQVKKNGELIGGTQAQATVTKAQTMLDEGNIEGAIAELQALEGPAAATAQPFIREAEVSLLAEKVQQLLGENILSKIAAQIPEASMLTGEQSQFGTERDFSEIIPQIEGIDNLNMDEVKKNLEKAIPSFGEQEVIKDEESGVTILPHQPGFKGFSGGQ